MKAFADLYSALDETNKTNEKIDALAHYFSTAAPADAAWALFFLSGRRLKQVIASRKLREWAIEAAGIPDWLFSECYDAVADSAETIALLLPVSGSGENVDMSLSYWVEQRLIPLRAADDTTQHDLLIGAWHELDSQQRFVWNKLITGAFRVGVSQQLITRALAQVSGVDGAIIAHRLMGAWEPTAAYYTQLIAKEAADGADNISRPFPFFLAYSIEEALGSLGEVADWQAEWKWDGIRAQLIRRAGQVFIWSRGEELITERFPEIASIPIPDGTVIDGEILPWSNGMVMPFAQLQRRIGRKTLTKKILSEVPVIFLSYDLLELNGADLREKPLQDRRAQLEALIAQVSDPRLLISPIVQAESWEQLATLKDSGRARNVEGLMIKRRTSPYRVGRQRGDWWKWKVNPFTVDAVLIYAQRGTGKRASLYTDYTLGVWDKGQLVPFAKAYSGLTDEEIRKVDGFIRQNTLETFGPVRTVKPELVFEIAFEAIQQSSRHKSGIAVRFPRILRWRTDKKIEDADSLETIRAMLPPENG